MDSLYPQPGMRAGLAATGIAEALIARSWQRSVDRYRLDPGRREAPRVLSASALRDHLEPMQPVLELARGAHPAGQPPSRQGTATHQLLLAVLGAAQHGRGRRGVAAELVRAWTRTGPYRGSIEELTPSTHDPVAAVPVVMAGAATLAMPRAWSWFAAGSVGSYALTTEGWQRVLDEADRLQLLVPRRPVGGRSRSGAVPPQ